MRFNKILMFGAVALLLNSATCFAEAYKLVPNYTSITFSVRQPGINNVNGRFGEFAGEIVMKNRAIAQANVTLLAKSIDTGIQKRDDRWRSADFFDAVNYPKIIFETKRIKKNRVYGKRHNLWDGRFTVIGNLTMRGLTKELRFVARQSGPARDPRGNFRIGLEAKINLNWKDYGISFPQEFETVPLLGEGVEIEISMEVPKASVRANPDNNRCKSTYPTCQP